MTAKTDTPITESTPVVKAKPKPEPEIINQFYEDLGIPYCKKCGEKARTADENRPICPIDRPNCAGFV